MPRTTTRPNTAGFQIFSGAFQAFEDSGKKIIRATASSAVELLSGDEITEGCVKDMVTQVQGGGMTIFLNHSYKVPEDVFGSTVRSDLVMRPGDMGLPVADMDIDVTVDESNPRAVQTYESIRGGSKLGVSIGADIVEWEFRDAKARFDGGVRFKKLALREASIVGIPKNPRSWVHSAVMALHSVTEPDTFIDELTEEEIDFTAESHPELPDSAFAAIDSNGRHYPHHHKDGSIWLSLLRNALARVSDPSNTQAGKGHLLRHAKEYGIGDHSVDPETTGLIASDDGDADDADEGMDSCPTCGGAKASPKGDCKDSFHNATSSADAPAIRESDLDEEELDSGEAPLPPVDLPLASDDGDEPAETNDVSPTETESLTEVTDVASSLALSGADKVVVEMVLSTLERTATELRESRSYVASLEATVAALTAERDEARSDLEEASQIVETLARLPLARKTAFVAPIQTFQSRFSGIYDERFLKLIDERSKED